MRKCQHAGYSEGVDVRIPAVDHGRYFTSREGYTKIMTKDRKRTLEDRIIAGY